MSSIGRPQIYDDSELLEAALRVFNAVGFADASMVGIANEAGVTRPTLYARLGSKEAIYERVLADASASVISEMRDCYEGVSAEDYLDFVRGPVVQFLGWARRNPARFELLFETEREHGEQALDQVSRLAMQTGADLLATRGLGVVPFSEFAIVLMTAAMRRGALWALQHEGDSSEDIDEFVARFLTGGLALTIAPERLARLFPPAEPSE